MEIGVAAAFHDIVALRDDVSVEYCFHEPVLLLTGGSDERPVLLGRSRKNVLVRTSLTHRHPTTTRLRRTQIDPVLRIADHRER